MTVDMPNRKGDVAYDGEPRYRAIFEDSPIALIEEDFSEVKRYLDAKKEAGVKNFRVFFQKNPQELLKCADLVRILDINGAGLKLLGISSKEKAKRGISQWYVKDSYLRFMEELLAISDGKTSFEAEGINMRIDGEIIYTLLKWNVVPGCEQDLCRTLVSMMDITERNRMWEALRSSEEKYRIIFETAANLIISISQEGLIVDSNNRVKEFLGYSNEEIIGQPIAKIFHPDHVEGVQKSLREIMIKGYLYNQEYQMVRRDGTIIDININSSALMNKAGKFDRCLCLVEDITKRKRAQDTLIWELAVNTALAKLYKPLLSRSSTITTMAASILTQAKFLTGSEHGYVSAIDSETGDNVGHTLTEMMKKGRCQLGTDRPPFRLTRGPDGLYGGLWGYALNTRIPFFTNAPSTHLSSKGVPEGHIPLSRFLSVPVMVGDELVGQIALANSHRDYNDRDLEAIVRMGELYALALRRMSTEAALEESEDKYRRLVESSTDGVVILQEGRVVYINPAGAKIVGVRKPLDLLGKKLPALLHPDYLSLLVESAKTPGRISLPILEREMSRLDGGQITIEVTALPFNFRGKSAVQAIFRDITERKKMEADLRSENEKLELITKNLGVGVAIISRDRRILWANSLLKDAHGKVEGQCCYSALHQLSKNCRDCGILKVFRGKALHILEQESTGPQGEKVWSQIITTPITNNKGDVIFALEMVIPITAQKKMEEALRESEVKYRELVENANSIIFKWAPDGRILSFNEFAEKFFGFSREEAIGKNIYETIFPMTESSSKDLSTLVSAIVSDKKYHDYINENIKKNGERVWVHWANKPLKDEGGQLEAILSVGTDITDRMRDEERLRLVYQQLLDIIDFLPDATLVIDNEEVVIAWNKAMEEMTGVPKQEMIGKGNYEYAVPFYGKRRAGLINIVLHHDRKMESYYDGIQRKGDTLFAETSVKLRGVERVVWATASPLYDTEGNIMGAIESIRDITDRKRIEQELLTSEEKYRSLFENIPDGIYQSSAEGKLLTANQALVEMLGYSSKKELLAIDITNDLYVSPEDRKTENERMNQFNGVRSSELVLKRKDGKQIHVLENAHVVRDHEGKVLYYEGTITDISERKRMEDALKNFSGHLADLVDQRAAQLQVSEERFRRIIESSPDPIMVVDEEGNVTECNQASLDLLKLDGKDKLLGRNYLEFVISKDKPIAVGSMTRAYLSGHLKDLEFSVINSCGQEMPVSISAGVIQESSEKLGSVVLMIKDISQRKMAETELKKAMDIREQFLSNITHELRTPLVSMMGYLEYVLSGKLGPIPDKITENLEVVRRNTDRLISLTNDILDIRRIQSGKIQMQLEHLDLRDIIQSCAKELKPFMEEKKQVLKFIGGKGPIQIEGDKIKLVQVLTNLLSNASKFTPQGGRITIETVDEGPSVRTTVSDSGIGIRQEDLERVFEPFTAIKKASYVRGTGLGLSVSRGLVEAHGGRIWAESQGEGLGARFIFILPKEVTLAGGFCSA